MQTITLETLYNSGTIVNVLDVGCNRGSFNYANLPKWQFTCVDQLNIDGDFPLNSRFINSNFMDFITSNRFDFVICKYVLEHQKDIDAGFQMIRKIHELMSRGGVALFVLPQGHCLSNTIYKSFFNFKIHEGLSATRDGGHWANYDEEILESQFSALQLKVIYKTIDHEDISKWVLPDGFPYDSFKLCVEYYQKRGIDLTANTMIYYVQKEV